MEFIEKYNILIEEIRKIGEVLSIGKSGGENLPVNNESDIDIFVFCSQIPNIEKRKNTIEKSGLDISEITINETGGRFWGICDFIIIDDTDICFMYFTVSDMSDEIDSVLNGSRLDRENEYFYPTGRCATFLSMHILCDKTGYIADMKKRLSEYPVSLAQKLYNHHIRKINDSEDFTRAVSRGDVLFYHAVLEKSIDHFLQALFALNQCFFPSRKRNMQFIEKFKHKPAECSERILKVIELGAGTKTLSQSYDIWCVLCTELSEFKNMYMLNDN